MQLRNLKEINVAGKTILYRAPYDIDTRETEGVLQVSDDLRIRATVPTIEYLINQNCKIVILTYVGRPNGQVVEKLRTDPHARKLSEFLKRPVEKIDDCIGSEVLAKIQNMHGGDVLMLENARFYPEEMVDDDDFAKKLCEGKELIVFDGFPQAHRRHASTTGIERHLPAVAGFYLTKEVSMLLQLLENPARPFTVIIGGAKISDKVDVIHNLLRVADTIIVGGASANVFLKSDGVALGNSFLEDIFVDKAKREKTDCVADARSILEEAKSYGKKIILPTDLTISDGPETKTVTIEEGVPAGFASFDIGPETRKIFSKEILESKTVFINGPMGKFEDSRFLDGSLAILDAMKNISGETIIAGGDTIDLVQKHRNLQNYTYASLAGGATLEFLAGKDLPALKALLR